MGSNSKGLTRAAWAVGTGGFSEVFRPIAGALKGPELPKPPKPEPPTRPDDANVTAAAETARRLALRRAGRSGTLLTTPTGGATAGKTQTGY